MYSTWGDLNITYYVGKVFGFFPFSGNHKCISFWYSLVLWILIVFSSILASSKFLEYIENIPKQQILLKKVICIELFINYIVAILNLALSAHRSERFFELLNKFHQFDYFILQIQCPSNSKTQTFYLIYVLFVIIYHLSVTMSLPNTGFLALSAWSLICSSTMIVLTQFITCIRLLRNRYKLANVIFKNSISGSTTGIKYLYSNEIQKLFIELRSLMEEIKTYYAHHVILIIMESVILLVSNVTKWTFVYTNGKDMELLHNKLFLIYCISKMIFLFFIVQEVHNTVQEFEIFILNVWNNPIVFNVYDIFDLDYKLLQSIIGSVVTYVVVLVQIQLAISNESQKPLTM